MTYTSIPVEQFGGLNLADDPREIGWNGAIDLLNVDFDKRGRLRSRDGLTVWTAVEPSNGIMGLCPYFGTSGKANVRNLVALTFGAGRLLTAYDDAGAVITTLSHGTPLDPVGPSNAVAFAAPTFSRVYIGSLRKGVYKYDGTTFAAVAASPNGIVAVQKPDNRLVAASYDRIQFSDAGAPETFGANNYVDVSPGDGEQIMALVAWRELLFAFKETKFFCFYGNSTSGSGNPVFNYRTVDTGIGARCYFGACASPRGIYFLADDGLYLTTGDPPQRVSAPVDRLLTGQSSSFYTGPSFSLGTVRLTANTNAEIVGMQWHRDRVFITWPAGTLVYHEPSATWSVWDVSSLGGITSYPTNGGPRELFIGTYGTGIGGSGPTGKHIARFSLSNPATTDNGTTIASRYRLGFRQIDGHRPDKKARVRQWRLKGSGTVTFGVAADGATAIPTTGGGAQASVTLADAPQANYRIAQRGNTFSPQVSASSGSWRLDEMEADAG